MRTSQCTFHTALHFSNVGTPHWLKVKRNLCCAFLCTHFHLVCHVLVERSFCPFHTGHVFTYVLCVKNLSVLNFSKQPAAASQPQQAEFQQCLDLQVGASGNRGLSRLIIARAFRQLVLMWIENLLLELFSVHSQKGKEIEIKTSCIR